MKTFMQKNYLINLCYLLTIILIFYTTIIRYLIYDILRLKFSLIDIVYNYNLSWLWLINYYVTIVILVVLLFARLPFLWSYFIVEKIVFVGFVYFQKYYQAEGGCISCGYVGSLISTNLSSSVILNILILIFSIFLFFSNSNPTLYHYFKRDSS